MTDPTVNGVIDWIVRGGAAIVAYWILTRVQKAHPQLTEDLMFYVTCGVTAGIGLIVWGFGIWIGYIALPGPTAQQWVVGGLGVLITVFSGSQVVYNLYQQHMKRVAPLAYAAKFPDKKSVALFKACDACVNPKEPRTLADIAWRGRGDRA